MSLKTWMKEFYPVAAEDAEDALAHSILKWTGLLPENRERHAVQLDGSILEDKSGSVKGGYITIDGDTCALCLEDNQADGNCSGCPLCIVRENCDCASIMCDEAKSPYYEFIDSGDPLPMLSWLRKAQAAENDKGRRLVTKGR